MNVPLAILIAAVPTVCWIYDAIRSEPRTINRIHSRKKPRTIDRRYSRKNHK